MSRNFENLSLTAFIMELKRCYYGYYLLLTCDARYNITIIAMILLHCRCCVTKLYITIICTITLLLPR